MLAMGTGPQPRTKEPAAADLTSLWNINKGKHVPHPTIHAACLASSVRALSGTCSRPAAFVGNRKKTSPHEPVLSGIKARFGALARYVAALNEKAALGLSAAAQSRQPVKQLEELLPLPETGTLLHFEAGDGGFLEAFHAARPGWELSAIESGDAFMRLLKKRLPAFRVQRGLPRCRHRFPIRHHRRHQTSG